MPANGWAMVRALILALIVVVGLPLPASAQWTLSAGVAPGGSYTRSQEQPPIAPPLPGSLPPITEERRVNEVDTFTRLSGRATYYLRGPRLDQRLNYLLGAYLYVQGSQSYSLSNDLLYDATYRVSPDTELGLTLTGQQGRTNELTPFDLLTGGPSVARPSTAENFLAGSAAQRFYWALGPFWSIGESLRGSIFEPLSDDTDQARTWGATAGLSLNRIWIQNTGTLYGRVGRGHSDQVATPAGVLRFPARDVDYGEAGLAWSHSYNDDWSHYLGGGLLGVKVPTELDTEYYMAVHTALTYLTATGGTIALNFDRGVYTNVFVGDVMLQTGGGLHGTQFFGRGEAWSATFGLDYQHSKSLLYVDVNESRLDVVSAIALLTWDWTRHKRWLFELTYTYQDSDEAIRNRRVVGPLKLNHFMAMATLEFSFPEQDEEAQQRRRVPARGRGGGPSTATIGSARDERAGAATGAAGGSTLTGSPMSGDRTGVGAGTRSDGPMP
jgi:hypothetical protein